VVVPCQLMFLLELLEAQSRLNLGGLQCVEFEAQVTVLGQLLAQLVLHGFHNTL
jgi:hypothetical protein